MDWLTGWLFLAVPLVLPRVWRLRRQNNYLTRNGFHVFHGGTCYCKAVTVTVPLVLPNKLGLGGRFNLETCTTTLFRRRWSCSRAITRSSGTRFNLYHYNENFLRHSLELYTSVESSELQGGNGHSLESLKIQWTLDYKLWSSFIVPIDVHGFHIRFLAKRAFLGLQ